MTPFTGSRIRKSLLHFTLGKALAGLIGVAILISLVRYMPAADYGIYVTWVAVMEITLLVSSAGVFAIAQRYITEARLPKNLRWLARLAWWSVVYRLATAALVAGVLALLSDTILGRLGQPQIPDIFRLYLAALVLEGVARYIELLFDGLLEQGRTQLSVLLRNGLRLMLLLTLWQSQGQLELIDVVYADLGAALAGALISTTLLLQCLRSIGPDLSEKVEANGFQFRRIARFTLPLYLAQCVTQVYSPEAVKMVVSAMLGVLQAAAFGFAHAISSMLQRYLPAQLLIGLIRPVLVARRSDGAGDEELAAYANLILKLNHFLLIPAIAFFAIRGDEFVFVVAKGKHLDAGPLLFWLSGLLLLQGLHLVLSVVATAVEDSRAILIGTLAATPGIIVGLLLIAYVGALGMVAGLWLSELLWCCATVWSLRATGFLFRIDWEGWGRLGLCAGFAILVTHLLARGQSDFFSLLLTALVLGTAYLAAAFIVKPFSAQERAMINRLLPRPFFAF